MPTENCRAYPVTPFPPKKEDAAGADKVVLAAAEAATHWLEAIAHHVFANAY